MLYANIDQFDAAKYQLDYDKLPVMDKWLLSKLNTLIKEVDQDLEHDLPHSLSICSSSARFHLVYALKQLHWGTPLNIWECASCGKMHSIGSREELEKMSGKEKARTVELHRPYPVPGNTPVLDIFQPVPKTPFSNRFRQDLFERQFPAQFISEAVDQTRGWFYSSYYYCGLSLPSPLSF